MTAARDPIRIATRGSALALAQAHAVLDQCRKAFPKLAFEIKIIKTTGDKLQTASLASPDKSLPKGLFTKELEVALLRGRADLAVHSLKDLPTELPAGLTLGAVTKRADVRDVLLYRDAEFLRREAAKGDPVEWSPGQDQRRGFAPGTTINALPSGAAVATSSTRRQSQLLARRPDLRVVELRGNVPTRLQKLAAGAEMDAVVLALAGLNRLHFKLTSNGHLEGDAVPAGLLGTVLSPETMLPAVGQGAVGIEVREDDGRIATVCARLDHYNTHQCVAAERALLRAMGGGCQSPVAAYAEVLGEQIRLQAVSYHDGTERRGNLSGDLREAARLGARLAETLR